MNKLPYSRRHTLFRSVSAWQGRIKRLLLLLPHGNAGAEDIRAYFGGIIEAFGDNDMEIVIIRLAVAAELCECGVKELPQREMLRLDPGMRCRIQLLNMYIHREELCDIEVWIQDVFLAVVESESGRHCLLDQHVPGVIWDSRITEKVAEFVSAFGSYPVVPVNVNIVGGDILPGGDFAIVGSSIFKGDKVGNDGGKAIGREEAMSFLRLCLGAEHIILIEDLYKRAIAAGRCAPALDDIRDLGHVDRYITLCGPLPDDPSRHLIYVAEIRPEWCCPHTAANRNKVRNIARGLDLLADELSRWNRDGLSFQVERLPLFVEKLPRQPEHYRLFNNCLVEVYGGVRRVYVPVYPDEVAACAKECYEATERAMVAAFARWNISVIQVNGEFPSSLGGNGSLRCASKILERDSV